MSRLGHRARGEGWKVCRGRWNTQHMLFTFLWSGWEPEVRELNLGGLDPVPGGSLKVSEQDRKDTQVAFSAKDRKPVAACFSDRHHSNRPALPSRLTSRQWLAVTFSITRPFHSRPSFLPPWPQ